MEKRKVDLLCSTFEEHHLQFKGSLFHARNNPFVRLNLFFERVFNVCIVT